MKIPIKRRERSKARVRRRPGRGAVGESGAKRNWRFCLADFKALVERIVARASVDDWEVEERSFVMFGGAVWPLEGDILCGNCVKL